MACYKSGGCGVYEMYSCSECPASKPEYANRNVSNGCSGCVYEDVDGSMEYIYNCVSCSRNVDYAKKDNYRRR